MGYSEPVLHAGGRGSIKEDKVMVWSGAGLHGLILAAFLTMSVIGIDPDASSARFFLVLAPILLVLGIVLGNLSYRLQIKWSNEEARKGVGYKVNRLCAILKCDFSDPPTVFFIPMPLLSVVSLIISLVIWSGIFA